MMSVENQSIAVAVRFSLFCPRKRARVMVEDSAHSRADLIVKQVLFVKQFLNLYSGYLVQI
jgi:hypothetical protein